jgi:periplasmic protein TonB
LSEYGLVPTIEPPKEAPVLRAGVQSSLDAGLVLKEESGLFSSLWGNVRDVFFPVKLPPLVLESKPIAVVDKMAMKQDPKATAASIVIYALAILLFLYISYRKVSSYMAAKTDLVTQLTPPPEMKPAKAVMGGGGGQRGATPVTQGHLPKFAETQITPPKIPVETKIQMPDATIEVQKDLKMANNTMPNFGMPNSPLVGNSMGNGSGSGLGSGNGSGLGVGSGGGYGGGVRQVGGGVSAPVLLYSPEPEFSEEARKAKVAGNVLVNLIVDAQGRPQNVRVVRGVGMGLDEQAVKAVQQYKFKPAMEAGKPVAVQLNVEVNFQIF